MRRKLTGLMEGRIEFSQFDNERMNRTNKLEGITKMVLNFDKLDNGNNLEDGNLVTLFLHIT